MPSRAARISWFLVGTLPALAGFVAGHPVLAVFLLVFTEAAIWVFGFAGGIVGDVAKRQRERIVEWLDQALLRGTSRFGKRYREFLVDTLRSIEEQGPATTGFYRPDLDEVFVDVGLFTQAPHRVSPSLLAEQQVTGTDRRNLDEFIDQDQPSVLAVIGAPGSGKSTLLRRTAREISRHRFRNRRTVPILLYLRDHTLAFQQEPIVVSPGELADSTHHARRVLLDMAGASADDDEDEDAYEGPTAWASKAAFALEEVAVPVFARKRDLTPDTATAVRLAALCLAAETPTLRTGVLSQTFRQLAAGVSLLERRTTGQAECNETIVLSVS